MVTERDREQESDVIYFLYTYWQIYARGGVLGPPAYAAALTGGGGAGGGAEVAVRWGRGGTDLIPWEDGTLRFDIV